MVEKEVSNNANKNNNNSIIDPSNKFTIQYTKEELDKIQVDFLEQISKHIARVNNRILKTLQYIEKEAAIEVTNDDDEEVELFPPTTITITNQQQEEELEKCQ
jgi:hypothetical protein